MTVLKMKKCPLCGNTVLAERVAKGTKAARWDITCKTCSLTLRGGLGESLFFVSQAWNYRSK